MTCPRKAKTTATKEERRNCLAPMNTNDIDKNGDRRPLTDIFCNTTIEQQIQFNVSPMIGVTILFLLFNNSELSFYYDDLDRAAVAQFRYQVFY
ncbi:hypothetical protein BCR33DRAFT_719250, partial [Rhizoclosmatium globosum]